VSLAAGSRRWLPRAAPVIALALLLGGCATTGDARGPRAVPKQRSDPWENWNRKVFAFNEGLDANLLKPVSTVYVNALPQFVRTGVDNFFNNAADAWSAINNLLQGKGEPAFQDFVRVSTNTTLGFFGLFDWASQFGLEHHYEDFGQTLGHWGLSPGPYVVWPVLGSSSVRDSVGLPLDLAASPALFVSGTAVKWGMTGVHLVNARADLLGASKLLDEIALDKYQFVRDAYLQRRRSLVYDGNPPDEPDPTDPGDVQDGAASAPPPPAAPPSAPK